MNNKIYHLFMDRYDNNINKVMEDFKSKQHELAVLKNNISTLEFEINILMDIQNQYHNMIRGNKNDRS